MICAQLYGVTPILFDKNTNIILTTDGRLIQ